jgi:hypothetical protein
VSYMKRLDLYPWFRAYMGKFTMKYRKSSNDRSISSFFHAKIDFQHRSIIRDRIYDRAHVRSAHVQFSRFTNLFFNRM